MRFRYILDSVYRKEIYFVFLLGDPADRYPYRSDPGYPITYDTLLISVFGGLINGAVISLCLFANATSGGTDFIAIYLSEKKGMDSWNLVLGLNVLILGAAGSSVWMGQGIILNYFQYASTQVLHTLYKKYQQQTLFVVTDHPPGVCDAISNTCHHGATILNGRDPDEHCERNMVYSVRIKCGE